MFTDSLIRLHGGVCVRPDIVKWKSSGCPYRKPVEGANVRLEQTTIGCATNPKGEFLLKDIKEGTYTLRTSCLNYAPVTQKVSQSQKKW